MPLPPPRKTGGMPLMEALAARHSSRSFAERPLDPQMLSDLLWAAYGINRPGEGGRTAPSAINAQEVDVYIALPEAPISTSPKRNSSGSLRLRISAG